ncbi:MMPL family transporter [Actinomadura rupiterrae]|uniref:MMPL family transporter n=1 Tax=Actinomadura rupiterrae TaxID=559627 RepID=UPI0020A55BB7|nr:MMPL family transporter [Actinomadura rupiterrae]MCP2339459.1 RND superfamily putative drug exporter [Actinomadura rupiterrae]
MSGANRISRLPCGRWTKWAVIVLWVVVVGITAPLAAKLVHVQKNDASSWLPKNAEATEVYNRSKPFVATDQYPAVVVYERRDGTITQADRDKATADAAALKAVTGKLKGEARKPIVPSVLGPTPSKDGHALQTIVNVKIGTSGWDLLGAGVKDFRKITQHGDPPGLSAHVTGPAGYGGDFGNVFSGFDKTLLLITAAIVILILLITYRSPILWMMPLLCVVFALQAAQGVVYLLAKHAGLTVNGQSTFILTVLVFGAGTDYALLLVARYREELRRHEDRHEAMAIALHRAGPAIIASGTTVAISMLVLLAAELNSTKSMGPVMAVGVGVALLAEVTLLPAVLVALGRWVFWPVRPKYGTPEPTERGLWARVGTRISVRPRITWIGTAVVLAVLSCGLLWLHTGPVANKDAFSAGKPDSVTGEEALTRHFPAGTGSPLVIVANAAQQPQVQAAAAQVPGVVNVHQVGAAKGGLAYMEGTLTARSDSGAAFTALNRTRTAVHDVKGADAKVGGGSAFTYDVSKASRHDQWLVIPIVLVVVVAILMALLRAVVAPVLLVLTVVLSYTAALGVSAVLFKFAFGFAGVDQSFPLWTFVFLVALGTDYNIFLMTRVHEEAKRHGTQRGALIGLSATGGVITSAGAVLAGTFAALGSLPLVFVTALGFTVAFGVLLDTFIVRSVLVTALNLDVGRLMWWPSRLARPAEVTRPDERETTPAG